MWRYGILHRCIGLGAGIIGLCAMALTMGLPDRLSYYQPIFHALVLWMLATGVAILRRGVNTSQTQPAASGPS
jgi:hypothetical protein